MFDVSKYKGFEKLARLRKELSQNIYEDAASSNKTRKEEDHEKDNAEERNTSKSTVTDSAIITGEDQTEKANAHCLRIISPTPFEAKEMPEPNLNHDGFKIEEGRYFFNVNKKGWQHVSNFILKPLYLLRDSKHPKRIMELTNVFGESTIICCTVKAMSSNTEFSALVEGRGNFVPSWASYQFSTIKEYIYQYEDTAEEITILGTQPDTGYYAFANGVFDGTAFYKVNEYGIAEIRNQQYYLPAFSKVNEDAHKEFHNERKFIFQSGQTTFTSWSKQLTAVFGQNAILGICFVVAAAFRDIVFSHTNSFPILFLFGPKGTGKTTFRNALHRLFGNYGPNDAIGLGSASSPKGFARKLAQIRNGLEAFEEYKNRIYPALIEMLKNIYDGIGYERAQTSNDNRTHATPVNSAVIVAGQEMPTKENALFSRVILLSFGNTSHTEEAKQDFRQLELIIDQGLGNVLLEIIVHRQRIEQEFAVNFNTVYAHLRKDPQTQHLEERSLTNVAALLAPFLVLSKHLAFPFDYKEAYRTFRDRITSQHDQMSKNNEVNQFWEVFDFLAGKVEIQENRHYKVSEDKKTLYLRLKEIHPKYMEQGKKQDATLLDASTLESYLMMQPYFKRPEGRKKFQQRFGVFGQKQCLAFELSFLELENLSQTLLTDTE